MNKSISVSIRSVENGVIIEYVNPDAPYSPAGSPNYLTFVANDYDEAIKVIKNIIPMPQKLAAEEIKK